MNSIGVGVVGTGIMARLHAEAAESYFRSHHTGFVSRAGSSADVEGALVARSVGELVSASDTQIVIVATPDFAHRDTTLEAIDAGCHVLVEKPLAMTSEDARQIRDAAIARGVKVMTLFNHRFVPSYWQAKQEISAGRVGAPVLAYARKNDTIHVPTEMISWSHRTTPAFFLSSHDLDLLLWYFDDAVERVHAEATWGVLRARGIETPDAVQAQLTFRSGAIATLESCWVYPDSFPTMTDSFMSLVFTSGVIHLDRLREQLEVTTADRIDFPKGALVNRVGGRLAGSVAAAIHHFVDSVLDDTDPLIDLDSSIHSTDVLVAIDQSWREQRTIKVRKD